MSTAESPQSLFNLNHPHGIQITPMTDEETIKLYEELVEWYGDKLANFEHCPRQFASQVKLYLYYKARKQNEVTDMDS